VYRKKKLNLRIASM